MPRNLKILSLSLMAAFAISAIAVSAAQAEQPAHFEPGSIQATNASEGNHTLTIEGLPTLTCTTVTGAATLAEKSAEVTSSAVGYETCHIVSFGLTFNAIVDMNECDLRFTGGTYTPAASKSDGSVHVVCPEGKAIAITLKNLSGEPKCEWDISAQTPTSGSITFNNATTEEKMALTVQAENVVIHAKQTTIAKHDALCTNTETKNSTYNGSFWAKRWE